MNKVLLPAKLVRGYDDNIMVKSDKQLYQMYFGQILGNESEVEVEISIQPTNSKKTNQQLRYFFGVVLPLIKQKFEEDTGEIYSVDEVSSFLKNRYCYHERWDPIENEHVKVLCSLASLSKRDCAKFITDCVNFANESLEIVIPEPVDYDLKKSVL